MIGGGIEIIGIVFHLIDVLFSIGMILMKVSNITRVNLLCKFLISWKKGVYKALTFS